MTRLLAIVLVWLLAGCATTPLPPFTSADGTSPVRDWRPTGPVKAQIVALHGFNDHKGAFDGFARFAAEHGVLVRAYDQPGFGEHAVRGFWPGSAALEMALIEQIRARRREHPKVPLYVIGESMGAAVTLAALARPDAPAIDGIVLSAPAVWGGKTLNPFYRGLLRLVSEVAPGLRLTGRGLKIRASDDIDMLIALGRDPLVIKETRADAIAGLVELMDETWAAAPTIRHKTLVLIGARDQVVPVAAQQRFVATLGSPACDVALYPEGWHLLLRDLQRERVWRDILAWVAAEPLPSGLAGPCPNGGTAATAKAPAQPAIGGAGVPVARG